jgi:hypothetical protein
MAYQQTYMTILMFKDLFFDNNIIVYILLISMLVQIENDFKKTVMIRTYQLSLSKTSVLHRGQNLLILSHCLMHSA